ncbi:DUF4197 domain-containing protein [Flavobacterium aciduliphilum]|uniref:Uncharacterized protein DUF4197 n=1 Tax=Flavobacterium aciduliphilum TaxID=1101402 RepID=A0A328YE22_9FLAO|nr:DUF4197 domain-containing protein [Flavobacterium aciduliphilum]RAR70865.1 uncharacterized protein DUF4197 [Flavobacterium aciduliphilum]
MRKICLVVALLPFVVLSQAKKGTVKPKIKTSIPKITTPGTSSNPSASLDIATGLKEALQNGVSKEVTKLALEDGFFKNEAVKILMPEELTKMENTLRKLGMGNVVDQGVLTMNRAAEDAVKVATPIFMDAIKNMTITDAKSILFGNSNAATLYLQSSTHEALYQKFSPIVQESIAKVGADVVWNAMISKYNQIPLISKVNPDLTDYITKKTMDGVFKMIAVEEENIRKNLKSRTSSVLQNVFGLLNSK